MSTTIEKIKQLLKSNFEQQLFEASLKNLEDLSNKLRYHNFCYSIRELSRHFLVSLSPDDLIKNCSWFKVETPNEKPTRAQRIKFAIQGGITDEALEKFEFDLETQREATKEIIKIIDSLSKYTHINPEDFDLSSEEIETKSQKVLQTFELLVETINDYREELKRFLDNVIYDHMIDAVITNSFESIDGLAPHYSLNYSEIEDYYIEEITDKEIIVNVNGNIHVTLEYGSRSERRNDDGLDIDETFPFDTKIRYSIDDFPTGSYEVDDFGADVSGWYGDDENDDYDEEIDDLISKL